MSQQKPRRAGGPAGYVMAVDPGLTATVQALVETLLEERDRLGLDWTVTVSRRGQVAAEIAYDHLDGVQITFRGDAMPETIRATVTRGRAAS